MQESSPSFRRVRALLFAVCASLLALLLTSGIMAVRFLGQMYAQEAAVRHALTERTQMLVGLWASVQGYRQAVESFVAKAAADRDEVGRRHLDQLGLEVDMELQRYPAKRTLRSQRLCEASKMLFTGSAIST